MQDHPDATPYEADNVITGVAARNSYLADRLGLARESLNNRENQQNTSNNLRQQSMQTRSDNARTNMAVQLFNNNPRRFKTIKDAKDFLDANPNMGGTPNLPMAQSETAPSAPATRPATPQEIASAQSVMARGASRQQVLEHAARNGITLPSGF